MNRNKIFGIIVVLILTTASAAIFTTGCYKDDNETRVTILLDRNDLVSKNNQSNKHLIDIFLEFFGTPAEAMGSWQSNQISTTLTLYVTSPMFDDKTFTIPAGAKSYSVVLPSSNNVNFTLISVYSGEKNWGGQCTVSLEPGEKDITLKMIPLTKIPNPAVGSIPVISWWSTVYTGVTSYNIYRADSINGKYEKIANVNGASSSSYSDPNMTYGIVYYYKISVNSVYGEGVRSDAQTGQRS